MATKKKRKKGRSSTPKIAKHGKTTAQQRRYIEYLAAKRKLAREFFG